MPWPRDDDDDDVGEKGNDDDNGDGDNNDADDDDKHDNKDDADDDDKSGKEQVAVPATHTGAAAAVGAKGYNHRHRRLLSYLSLSLFSSYLLYHHFHYSANQDLRAITQYQDMMQPSGPKVIIIRIFILIIIAIIAIKFKLS